MRATGLAGALGLAAAASVNTASAQDVLIPTNLMLLMSDVRIATEADCGDGWFAGDADTEARCVLSSDFFFQIIATGLTAIEHFNTRNGAFVSEFAELGNCDKKIDPHVFDESWSPPVAVKELLTSLATASEPPRAIIGPALSSASMPASLISGLYDIPQISYWSTSAQLDDLSMYPRFQRTIPTDDAVAFSICKYWRSQGFRYAAIIYGNDNYGEAYKESLVDHCEGMGLTKVYAFSFFQGSEDTEASIKVKVKAMAETGVKVFLIVTAGTGVESIFAEAHKLGIAGKGTSWMVSEAVNTDTLGGMPDEAVRMAASGTLQINAAGGMADNPVWMAFREAYSTLDVAPINAHLPSYFQLPDDLFQRTSPDVPMVRNIGAYLFDAISTVGLMACRIAPTGPLPDDFGTQFFTETTTATDTLFTGLSGKVLFDEIGNRHRSTANYEMANFVLAKDKATVGYELVARFDTDTQTWTSVESNLEKPLFNGNSTAQVFDRDIPVENKNYAGATTKSICRALFGLNLAGALFYISWTITNRKLAVVKASQARFLVVVAIGGMISSSAIIPLTFDDSHVPDEAYNLTNDISLDGTDDTANMGCQLAVWLYAMGFVLTYSSLATKIYRVNNVFNSKTLRAPKVSTALVIKVISACAAVDISIIVAWTLSDPLVYQRVILSRDNFGSPLESVGGCVSSSSNLFISLIAVFHLSLLFYGSFLAYKCRSVHTAFSEGKYIAVAMVSNLQVMALAIPVLIIVSNNPESSMFLSSGVLFLNDLSVMSLIFVPKIVMVVTGVGAEELRTAVTNSSSKTAMKTNLATSALATQST